MLVGIDHGSGCTMCDHRFGRGEVTAGSVAGMAADPDVPADPEPTGAPSIEDRIATMLDKALAELTVAEVLFLVLALDDADEFKVGELIGYTPPAD